MPLGLVAGFVDATGGGGGGPVATPTLLAGGQLDPRKVIGSVSTAEFAVTVAISVGFLTSLGNAGIDWRVVVGLLVDGVVAAPFAAWLVRHVSLPMLGALAGGIILITNSRTLMRSLDYEIPAVYIALFTGWAILIPGHQGHPRPRRAPRRPRVRRRLTRTSPNPPPPNPRRSWSRKPPPPVGRFPGPRSAFESDLWTAGRCAG